MLLSPQARDFVHTLRLVSTSNADNHMALAIPPRDQLPRCVHTIFNFLYLGQHQTRVVVRTVLMASILDLYPFS